MTRTSTTPSASSETWLEPVEPYYRSQGDEVTVFAAAHARRMPVLLKGPTGCGKTRFLRHMAWSLGRPLVTVACHEDLSASDLVGRFLLKDGETAWVDGPLTLGLRLGAIVYLDEIVEARRDIVVVIHPLADDRRILVVEKLSQVLPAPPEFMLVASFNPGYQSALKDLKQSTRQRFVGIALGYPERDVEIEIIAHETGISTSTAATLVTIAQGVRRLVAEGLEEGTSTRSLVDAASLIDAGVAPRRACRAAMAEPLTDDPDLLEAIGAVIDAHLPE